MSIPTTLSHSMEKEESLTGQSLPIPAQTSDETLTFCCAAVLRICFFSIERFMALNPIGEIPVLVTPQVEIKACIMGCRVRVSYIHFQMPCFLMLKRIDMDCLPASHTKEI